MDIVAACRAFVSVSDRGSFTIGAAAAGMQQSVASRRIAALEKHLGGALFDRSTRRSQLTSFGRGLIPGARQVVLAAEALEQQARRSRSSVIRLSVPEDCSAAALGAVIRAGRAAGIELDPVPAPPANREEALASGAVQAAVVPVPAERALWSIPLGVASVRTEGEAESRPVPSPFHLGTIRPSRHVKTRPRRLLYEHEDDIPAIRDVLLSHRDAQALTPAQVQLTESVPAAVADLLGGDLLLCTRARATQLGLEWAPLAEIALARSYTLATDDGDWLDRVGPTAALALGRALGEPR